MTNKKYNHNYPEKIEYHCKIHNTKETAHFIGCMQAGGIELALYNTPQGHTLSLESINEIMQGKWTEEKWKRYADFKPLSVKSKKSSE